MKYKFWKCGGGPSSDYPNHYCFGVWTGPDGDLMCPFEIKDLSFAHQYCSPVARNRFLALIGFVGMYIAGKVDYRLEEKGENNGSSPRSKRK